MINGRFATVIHILTLLAQEEGALSSSYIAGSININPVLVRKEISVLRAAGFVVTQEGKNGGSSLAMPPSKIRLSDLYRVVYKEGLFAHSRNLPNQHCTVGKRIGVIMDGLNTEAEQALLKRFRSITIRDLLERV
ncbi:RrF2 family transcriptional regulator [Niabella drilacis]|uniref:DNA-binding transcriptional regulator, IscR family n=1 Tax=Niabella drilacis (strain DSM 25811 / CCM 8410 / CCUG 62505 / LMG 26954 / E90) TaxID=1285928 RepID=A0A1G6U146_NIADE|nr:Rrf2 family transcriptional regulator [Niabella drilacis]SDD34416.1 DNA-binding transcriptional regulator, IscR family [Niabella drilacis]